MVADHNGTGNYTLYKEKQCGRQMGHIDHQLKTIQREAMWTTDGPHSSSTGDHTKRSNVDDRWATQFINWRPKKSNVDDRWATQSINWRLYKQKQCGRQMGHTDHQLETIQREAMWTTDGPHRSSTGDYTKRSNVDDRVGHTDHQLETIQREAMWMTDGPHRSSTGDYTKRNNVDDRWATHIINWRLYKEKQCGRQMGHTYHQLETIQREAIHVDDRWATQIHQLEIIQREAMWPHRSSTGDYTKRSNVDDRWATQIINWRLYKEKQCGHTDHQLGIIQREAMWKTDGPHRSSTGDYTKRSNVATQIINWRLQREAMWPHRSSTRDYTKRSHVATQIINWRLQREAMWMIDGPHRSSTGDYTKRSNVATQIINWRLYKEKQCGRQMGHTDHQLETIQRKAMWTTDGPHISSTGDYTKRSNVDDRWATQIINWRLYKEKQCGHTDHQLETIQRKAMWTTDGPHISSTGDYTKRSNVDDRWATQIINWRLYKEKQCGRQMGHTDHQLETIQREAMWPHRSSTGDYTKRSNVATQIINWRLYKDKQCGRQMGHTDHQLETISTGDYTKRSNVDDRWATQIINWRLYKEKQCGHTDHQLGLYKEKQCGRQMGHTYLQLETIQREAMWTTDGPHR